MKTPRQILFECHHSAIPKLDAIRQTALASVAPVAAPDPRCEKDAPGRLVSLSALLLLFRWHLAGLGAAWLLIALLNIDHSSAPAPTIAQQTTRSPQQFLMALRENRRQLLELIEPSVTEPSPAPHPLAPPRRSELLSLSAMA